MEGGSVDTEVIEDQPAHKEMSGVRQPCILIFDSLAGTLKLFIFLVFIVELDF